MCHSDRRDATLMGVWHHYADTKKKALAHAQFQMRKLQIMMSDGNIFYTSPEEKEELRRMEAAKARARQMQKLTQTASAGAVLGAAGLT